MAPFFLYKLIMLLKKVPIYGKIAKDIHYIYLHFFIYSIEIATGENEEMEARHFYTYIFFKSSSITFQGKKADALKIAEEYHMYIKEERNGFFVLAKNAEAIIYEHDDSDNIIRQVDPRPYLKKSDPNSRLTEKKVSNLVDDLNAGYLYFEDLSNAAS